VDARAVDDAVQRFQRQLRGPVPEGDMIALDGKAAKRSQGAMILNAVALPSLQYLGSEMVPTEKTNEIPVARKLFERLDMEGKLVGLDALHTQTATACALVQDAGGDYLLTVKGNQEGLEERLQTRFTATPAVFSPSTDYNHAGMDRRTEQGPTGATPALVAAGNS
jgi:hypothetical protein